MKVCDKCKKELGKGNIIKLQREVFEVCDQCASKIVQWLKEPQNQGFLGGIFK